VEAGKVAKMLWVLVFSFQFLLIHLESVLTGRYFLSSSVHLSFFCLMDDKIGSFVAALTNKDKTFLSYHFSAHVHYPAGPGTDDVTWLLLDFLT
jgi:hypothetical protein